MHWAGAIKAPPQEPTHYETDFAGNHVNCMNPPRHFKDEFRFASLQNA